MSTKATVQINFEGDLLNLRQEIEQQTGAADLRTTMENIRKHLSKVLKNADSFDVLNVDVMAEAAADSLDSCYSMLAEIFKLLSPKEHERLLSVFIEGGGNIEPLDTIDASRLVLSLLKEPLEAFGERLEKLAGIFNAEEGVSPSEILDKAIEKLTPKAEAQT